MTTEEAVASLEKLFGEKIQNKTEFRGETSFTIAAGDLHEMAKFCRDELSFDYLLDITSIDNFGEDPRFEIVYHLYSMPHGVHLRLKLRVLEELGAVDTISDIWPTANWHEREAYDMMGIKFTGHPDLRRILMWDGYPFFPLRTSRFRAVPAQRIVSRVRIRLNCRASVSDATFAAITQPRLAERFQVCAWRPSRLGARFRRAALPVCALALDKRFEYATSIEA